jgi:hypothetical protein
MRIIHGATRTQDYTDQVNVLKRLRFPQRNHQIAF